jgi:nucleoside-diphosphate-sugar epimerase
MKVLVTGGAGFLGARLARTLLARGQLAGRAIDRLVVLDQVAPPDDLGSHPRVEVRTAPLREATGALVGEPFDAVFHLAAAVSAECEADFDLGMQANLDGTRNLLDALRRTGNVPRFVFASSIAVYGRDGSAPLPAVVTDTTLPAPQTSYGTQKLIGEHLVADCTRKGFVDGRAARLMTVTVRPGRPNGAASSFFSGIIREPLAGVTAVCPVPLDVTHPVSSPARTIEGLIAVGEASREQLGGRLAVNLPGISVRVGAMLDALEAVAGRSVRDLVRVEIDERIHAIVQGWPAAAEAPRAARLGLRPDESFESIVRQHVAETGAGAA